MRHRTVPRIALALGGGFVLAALLFTWSAGGRTARAPLAPADRAPRAATLAPAGAESLYGRACAACHVAADLAEELAGAPDETEAALGWLRFLDAPGPASLEEDHAIVLWLVEQARARAPQGEDG